MVLPLDFFFLHLLLFSDHLSFQSLVTHIREKSRFLHEHKEEWDRLIDEARLHRDMTAQLHQRVAELTPLAAEADDLRRQEAEACQHVEDVVGMF